MKTSEQVQEMVRIIMKKTVKQKAFLKLWTYFICEFIHYCRILLDECIEKNFQQKNSQLKTLFLVRNSHSEKPSFL